MAVQLLISLRKHPANAGPRSRRAGGSQRDTERWPSTHHNAKSRSQGMQKSSKSLPNGAHERSKGVPKSKRDTETRPSTDQNAKTRPQGAQRSDQSLPNGTHEKPKGCPRAEPAAKGTQKGHQKATRMRGCGTREKP